MRSGHGMMWCNLERAGEQVWGRWQISWWWVGKSSYLSARPATNGSQLLGEGDRLPAVWLAGRQRVVGTEYGSVISKSAASWK